MKKVKIIDLPERTYKVVDVETNERLMLAGDASLLDLVNKILSKGWQIDHRITNDGAKVSWHKNSDGSFNWE